MPIVKICDGCQKELSMQLDQIFPQKIGGKDLYFCKDCNKKFPTYKEEIQRLWEKIDQEKHKEIEEIKKKIFEGVKENKSGE